MSLKGYCPSKGALVYEFMEGGNLQQFIESPEMRARYGFRRRVSWLLQIASGMAFLHNGSETPIRHWDVKPANVVLDADHLVAKLTDMGMAKYISLERRTTTRNGPRGTLPYLDPEYTQGHRYTTASNVFSFGMVAL